METGIALSRSASSNTILAALPPSSKDTRFSVSAPIFIIAFPVVVSPVNEIKSTSGSAVIYSPADPLPKPWTTLTTPSGIPASFAISPSSETVSGVASAGLITAVFPAARHGPSFHVVSISGKFHGVINAATPTGSYLV
ncbi:hypothetical protein D1872_224530 [compost metagenome]